MEELVTDVLAERFAAKISHDRQSARRSPSALGSRRSRSVRRSWNGPRSEGTLSVQAILGALPDGLVVVDDGGRIQMMNAEFNRVFGEERPRRDAVRSDARCLGRSTIVSDLAGR